MKNFVCICLAIAVLAFAAPLYAQCNSANGQCGAPNGLSAAAINGLAFQQQQSAASSSASSAVAPAAPVAPQFGYQMYSAPAYQGYAVQGYAAPAYGYAAQATVVHPSQLYFALPPMNPTQPAPTPAPEGVAVTPPTIPVQPGYALPSYYSLIGFQGAPVAAASGGAAASASASAGAPVAVAPIAVNPGLAQASASGGCASGNCGARRGLFGGGLFARRSSSKSVSISRSRVR